MKIKRLLLGLSVVAVLSGCATPYQQMGMEGGYENLKLSEDTYKVLFKGNNLTSSSTVADYALRRCAELTKQNGYKYFVILTSNVVDGGATFESPASINTTSYGTLNGNTYGSSNSRAYNGNYNNNTYTTVSPGTVYQTHFYTQTVIMKMSNSAKQIPHGFNAEIILSNFTNPQMSPNKKKS